MLNKLLFFITFLLFVLSYETKSVVVYGLRASETTINLTKSFSKDIFESNGVNYLQPLATSLNATSNSRFYNQAYVPKKVSTPYFKFSLNGMLGFVRNDQKTYKPYIPNEPLDSAKLMKYINVSFDPNNPIKILDTVGFYSYIFKVYAWKMIQDGKMVIPNSAPTILGSKDKIKFDINTAYLKENLVQQWPTFLDVSPSLAGLVSIFPWLKGPIFAKLSPAIQEKLLSTIDQFPSLFDLPQGNGMNSLVAGIPQLEIGSLFGTELLLRFIPPVNLGSDVGDFAFWGIGLKHSLSQYFPERWFDLAIQGVYQGTSLTNQVGFTKADLTAKATIWSLNLHASKNFWEIFDIYTGISYDYLNISTSYKYYIPITTQYQLGLIAKDCPDQNSCSYLPTSADFPGDTSPQTTSLSVQDKNIKWTVGLRGRIGPFALYLDYSISKFNVFSGGLEINANDMYHFIKTGKFTEKADYDESEVNRVKDRGGKDGYNYRR